MKNNKAWGIEYEDHQSTVYGWIDPVNAPIHNPKFCHKPSDATYEGSNMIAEMNTGKLVHVTRITEVKIDECL